MKSIKSFGCSFILGTDLSDLPQETTDRVCSALTYPALIAKTLGHEYSCRAWGGTGNLRILNSIMTAIQDRQNRQQLPYIINWTYIDRYDYDGYKIKSPTWATVLPVSDSQEAQAYYTYFHSDFDSRLRSLVYMFSAIQALSCEGIPFVMTYMDPLLFDDKCDNSAVRYLQDQVRPNMTTFDGTDFLTWSRRQNFAISDLSHPLEDAHQAAAEYLLPIVESILHKV